MCTEYTISRNLPKGTEEQPWGWGGRDRSAFMIGDEGVEDLTRRMDGCRAVRRRRGDNLYLYFSAPCISWAARVCLISCLLVLSTASGGKDTRAIVEFTFGSVYIMVVFGW